MYAFINRQEHDNFPDVVTIMIHVFEFTIYALLDPGTSLSFVNPYTSMNFDISPEQLSDHSVFPHQLMNPFLQKESIMIFPFLSITRVPWLI